MKRRPIDPEIKCEAMAQVIATLVSAILVMVALFIVTALGMLVTGG